MKTILIILFAVLLMTTVWTMHQTAQAQAIPTYRVLRANSFLDMSGALEKVLNEQAQEGWSFIGIMPSIMPGNGTNLIFRKP